MKAVVWTDVVQCVIMIFGMLSIFVRATMFVGGLDEMMDAAVRGGRSNLFKYATAYRNKQSFIEYILL